MEDLLLKVGLSSIQARVYLYLLEQGEQTPPHIATQTHITRTNAYRVLERLEQLSLVQKSDANKKILYRATDPVALASLAGEERNRIIALEHAVNDALQQFRETYHKGNRPNAIATGTGRTAIVHAYQKQIDAKKPLYFIRTQADTPFMGFEVMDRIRRLPASRGIVRYGITPDVPGNPTTPIVDGRTNLTRTIIPHDSYTAPVEWTLAGDELLIQVFEGEGRYIAINDATIAEAFKQVWQLIDTNVRAQPNYNPIGTHAKRQL